MCIKSWVVIRHSSQKVHLSLFSTIISSIVSSYLIHKRDKTEFKHKQKKEEEKLRKEGKDDNEIENELKNKNLDKMNQGQSINYREVIKVEPKPNEFLFKIESTRSLSAKKIILEAFNILKQKFGEIDKILNEIEDKENWKAIED